MLDSLVCHIDGPGTKIAPYIESRPADESSSMQETFISAFGVTVDFPYFQGFYSSPEIGGTQIEVERTHGWYSFADVFGRRQSKLFGIASTVEFNAWELAIGEVAVLLDGWDGYEGCAPSRESIADAMELASYFEGELDSPRLSPLSEGALAMYWRRGQALLEIELDGSGTAHVLIDQDPSAGAPPSAAIIPITKEGLMPVIREFVLSV